MKKTTIILITLFCIFFLTQEIFSQCKSGDCKNGQGIYQLQNGSRYVGEFKDGKFNGRGTYYFFNGSRYEGNWKNGEMSGEGTWHYANGMKLRGTFSNDRVTREIEITPVKTEKPASHVIPVIPNTTRMIVKIKSIENVFRNFPVNRQNYFKSNQDKILLKKLIEMLGFNPFIPEDIAKLGIDIKKEVAIALPSLRKPGKDKSDINVVLCIPMSHPQKAVIKFKNILRRLSKMEITFTRDNDITIINSKEKNKTLCMAEKKGYLLVGFNPDGDVIPYMRSFMKNNNSLGETAGYRSITRKIKSDEDIFMYFDPVLMNDIYHIYTKMMPGSRYNKKKNPAAVMNQTFGMIKNAHKGLGMNISCDKKDLVIKSAFIFNPDSDLLKIYKEFKYNKIPVLGIKEKPVMLLASGMNFREYYNFILKSMGQENSQKIKKHLKNFSDKEGIDIEKDIINNIAGSINFGIFDGVNFSQQNPNILMTFNVKNAMSMKKTIEKLVKKMPPSRVKWYGKGKNTFCEVKIKMLRIKVGMFGNNVIIALGDKIFRSSMNASMKNSFLKKFNHKELISRIKSDINIFYFDSQEIRKLINAVPIFASRFRGRHEKILSQFQYFFAYNILKENTFFTDMTVKTNFKEPFFRGVSKMLQKIRKQ